MLWLLKGSNQSKKAIAIGDNSLFNFEVGTLYCQQ
jgi:hypothetical protein